MYTQTDTNTHFHSRNMACTKRQKTNGAAAPTILFLRSGTVSEGVYVGTTLDGKPHGNGTMNYHDSKQVYYGGWQHGVRHGEGTLVFPDGSRCQGQWRNGQQLGPFTFLSLDGVRRNGQMFSKFHGYLGTPSGSRYFGELHDYVPHGIGARRRGDEYFFSGFWNKGERQGPGVEKIGRADWNAGSYKDDKLFGLCVSKRGNCTHSGFWRDGKLIPNHQVVVLYSPGGVHVCYRGFVRDETLKPHGSGVMKFADETCYVGHWLDGQANGVGMVIDKSGKWISYGIFHMGTLVSGVRRSSSHSYDSVAGGTQSSANTAPPAATTAPQADTTARTTARPSSAAAATTAPTPTPDEPFGHTSWAGNTPCIPLDHVAALFSMVCPQDF